MRTWLLLVVAVPSLALADFTGRVVKVVDSDTLTVLVNQRQVRVRLESIDAPERLLAMLINWQFFATNSGVVDPGGEESEGR